MIISRRRLLGSLAAAAVAGSVAGTLAGCGGGDSGDGKADVSGKDTGAMKDFGAGTQFTATEPLDFSLLFSDHPAYPEKKNWMLWSSLTAKTKVTLQPTIVPLSDFEQKRSLLIGAGSAPDVIAKCYPGTDASFWSSGAILPVSDYTHLMPNFTQKVKDWKLDADLDGLRQADGKYYLLPGLHQEVWQDYTVAARTDLMSKLGLEAPKDWDAFRTMLQAIRSYDPDHYPLSDRFSESGTPAGNLLNIVATTYGTHAGWGWTGAQWNAGSKAFEFTGTTEQYQAFVGYMAGLASARLLDPESFTQDDDSAVQKFVTGKSSVISANAQSIVNDYRTPLAKNIKGGTVAKLPLPAGPVGDVLGGTRLENGLMLNAKVADRDDFVALLQFIDWLWYSDAGEVFAKWGIEGSTYTKSGDTYTLESKYGSGQMLELQKQTGFSGGNFAYGGTTELLWSTFTAEEKKFQQQMATKTLLPADPPYPFDEATAEQANLLATPLEDYVSQMTLKFILGQRPLSEWPAYVSEVKAKGSDRYLQLVNQAYQDYAKNHG